MSEIQLIDASAAVVFLPSSCLLPPNGLGDTTPYAKNCDCANRNTYIQAGKQLDTSDINDALNEYDQYSKLSTTTYPRVACPDIMPERTRTVCQMFLERAADLIIQHYTKKHNQKKKINEIVTFISEVLCNKDPSGDFSQKKFRGSHFLASVNRIASVGCPYTFMGLVRWKLFDYCRKQVPLDVFETLEEEWKQLKVADLWKADCIGSRVVPPVPPIPPSPRAVSHLRLLGEGCFLVLPYFVNNAMLLRSEWQKLHTRGRALDLHSWTIDHMVIRYAESAVRENSAALKAFIKRMHLYDSLGMQFNSMMFVEILHNQFGPDGTDLVKNMIACIHHVEHETLKPENPASGSGSSSMDAIIVALQHGCELRGIKNKVLPAWMEMWDTSVDIKALRDKLQTLNVTVPLATHLFNTIDACVNEFVGTHPQFKPYDLLLLRLSESWVDMWQDVDSVQDPDRLPSEVTLTFRARPIECSWISLQKPDFIEKTSQVQLLIRAALVYMTDAVCAIRIVPGQPGDIMMKEAALQLLKHTVGLPCPDELNAYIVPVNKRAGAVVDANAVLHMVNEINRGSLREDNRKAGLEVNREVRREVNLEVRPEAMPEVSRHAQILLPMISSEAIIFDVAAIPLQQGYEPTCAELILLQCIEYLSWKFGAGKAFYIAPDRKTVIELPRMASLRSGTLLPLAYAQRTKTLWWPGTKPFSRQD